MIFLFNGGDCSSFLKVHSKKNPKKKKITKTRTDGKSHMPGADFRVENVSKPGGCPTLSHKDVPKNHILRESETTTLPERGLMFMRHSSDERGAFLEKPTARVSPKWKV